MWGRPHGCWGYRVRETGGDGLRYGRSLHRVGGSQVRVGEGKRTRDGWKERSSVSRISTVCKESHIDVFEDRHLVGSDYSYRQ